MPSIPSMSQQDLLDLLRDLNYTSDLLPQALVLAERVHGTQRRAGGGPYLDEHIYPITADVARYLARADSASATTAVLIAILHDTIEDSADVTVADLAAHFGPAVASGVDTLSKPSKRGGLSVPEDATQEAHYVAGIAVAPREIRIIKIFDRINNLSAVHQRPPAKCRQYLNETRAYYLPLARGVDEALAERMAALVNAQAKLITD